MRCQFIIGFVVMALAANLFGKGEYNSKYLYTETKPEDKGGIVVKLDPGEAKVVIVVALARKSRKPYLAELAKDGKTATFTHLPVDKYDLLVLTAETIYEGIELVGASDPELVKNESEPIAKEVKGIEAFFEGKNIERTEIEGQAAGVLLQQWRIGTALAESGAVLKGTIHSIDVIWFEKPLNGWQLVKRRQLYRDEIARKEPFKHRALKELSNIRVADGSKTVTVKLPAVP